MHTNEERNVKYVVLIYSNPATWEVLAEPERARVMATHFRLIEELTASGELLRVDGLADAEHTKSVRLVGGAPVVTDGPFTEAKEQLAGVWALDVENVERAIEIAAPIAEYDFVEIRPLMDLGGEIA
jgi:hypothetical protein